MSSGAAETDPARRLRDRLPTGIPALGVLYLVSCTAYALLGRGVPAPTIAPDEFTYGGLARSVADGDGLTLLGDPVHLRAALYVYLISPAWLLSSTVSAYAVTKVIGAVAASLTVIPAWLLARRYVSARWALVAAGLAVFGTWMTVTSAVILENAGYPLATAALASTVALLSRPGSRWGWAALAFAVVAGGARLQLVVLVPLLGLSIVADVARGGRAWRARLTAYGWFAAVPLVISVVGGIAVIAARSTTLGGYGGIRLTPPLGALAHAVGWQAVGLVAMSGIVPVCATLAISSRRVAWRDAEFAPLLTVTWCAVLVFVAQSAWAIAGFDGLNWHIQRYAMYPLPLLFVAMIAGASRGYLGRQRLVIAGSAIALAELLAPEVRNIFEEFAQFALDWPTRHLLGLTGSLGLPLIVATVTGIVVGAATLAARRHPLPLATLIAVAAITLLTLAAQDVRAWSWRINSAQTMRRPYPADLQWLDHRSGEPIAVLVGRSNTPYNDVTKFFNRTIQSQLLPYGPVSGEMFYGRLCRWRADPRGLLQISGGCPPRPHRFYLEDHFAKFAFYDQRIEADRPGFARVVTTPTGSPARLRASLGVICGPPVTVFQYFGDGRKLAGYRACVGSAVTGEFWLDTPGVLELTFAGGTRPQRVLVGKVRPIPPGARSVVRIPIPAANALAPTKVEVPIDWDGAPPDVPDLVGARLVQRGTTTDLLY